MKSLKCLSLLLLLSSILYGCSSTEKILFSDKDCEQNWALRIIFSDEFYNVKKTDTPVKVAILDSGINTSEPALRGKVKNTFNSNPNGVSDVYGHGTAIASIVAADLNETTIRGVATNVDIYNVKVLNDNGQGELKDVIEGIKWSVDQKVDIINLSFGFQKNEPELEQVIDEALSAGIIIVAAAGNTIGLSTEYPAKYEGVISVSAIDRDMKLYSYAARGKVDFVAPGVDIRVLGPLSEMETVSGTSFATAYVTGVIANLLSIDNSLSAKTIIEDLNPYTKDLGDHGYDKLFGHGVLTIQ